VSERTGDWQLTASGRIFWLLDPRPEDIEVGDIAHHLGRICRWGGAPREHYSVAEHSVILARYFVLHGKHDLSRWALLHDAAEAYLGDIVRPLKPFMVDALAYERRLERTIWDKYGLAGELPEAVKIADTAILGDERDQLFGPDSQHARMKRPGEIGLGVRLPQWCARRATAEFRMQFMELFSEHRA
jgi:hypothetical protein